MQRALQWFDVHVAGAAHTPNRPAVEVADESGKTVRGYAGLPPTARHTYTLRGTKTIGASGKIVRGARTPQVVETFGAPTVQVRASSTTGWTHLVAVLVARGEPRDPPAYPTRPVAVGVASAFRLVLRVHQNACPSDT